MSKKQITLNTRAREHKGSGCLHWVGMQKMQTEVPRGAINETH